MNAYYIVDNINHIYINNLTGIIDWNNIDYDIENIDWVNISKGIGNNIKFINKYINNIKWEILLEYNKYLSNEILDLCYQHIEDKNIFYILIFSKQGLSTKKLKEYYIKSEKKYKNLIIKHQILSKDFLYKYGHEFDINLLIKYQHLHEQTILKYIETINLNTEIVNNIILNQTMTENIINKCLNLIDWKFLLLNTILTEKLLIMYYEKYKYITISSERDHILSAIDYIFETYKLSQEFINKYYTLTKWNYIIENQRLSETFIEKHIKEINLYFSNIFLNSSLYIWRFITINNTELSETFILKYIKEIKYWSVICKRKQLSYKLIVEILNIIDKSKNYNRTAITTLFINYKFSQDYINQYLEFMNWNEFIENNSFEFIKNLSESDIIKYEKFLDWRYISYKHNSIYFLNKFKEKINWSVKITIQKIPYNLLIDFFNSSKYDYYDKWIILFVYQQIPEQIINKYKQNICWIVTSRFQNLSLNFINNNIDKISFDELLLNKKIKLNILLKFKHKFNINCFKKILLDRILLFYKRRKAIQILNIISLLNNKLNKDITHNLILFII